MVINWASVSELTYGVEWMTLSQTVKTYLQNNSFLDSGQC